MRGRVFPECVHNVMFQHGLAVSLLLGGLVGSVTHCAGMCSPFVLAQVEDGPLLQKPSGSLLIPYHLGRMTTYVALGALFHSVINIAYLFSAAKVFITAPLLMIAGVLFLVSAFPPLSTLFPWTARIGIPVNLRLIDRMASPLFRQKGFLSRYMLGVLLGFMPCGLVLAALMASSTAPSLAQAVAAMAAFSIGTIPSLMAIGFFGRSFKHKFPTLSRRVSQTAMLVSSIWLFVLAGNMLF